MTKDEKIEFIQVLTDSVRNAIITKVQDMPEEWDGLQIRQYISDYFREQVVKLSSKDRKRYINDVAINNL